MTRLEVLCDAAVPLLGEYRGVLYSRVSSCGHIPNDWLLGGTVAVVVGPVLVVCIVVVVLLLVVHRVGVVA